MTIELKDEANKTGCPQDVNKINLKDGKHIDLLAILAHQRKLEPKWLHI